LPVRIVVPTPSVSYAIYGLLSGLPEVFWLPVETAPLRAVVDEFYERTIDALRAVTELDQFVYAVNTDYEQHCLWPHRAEPTRLWPPDMGDISNLFGRGPEPFFLAVDFSFGFCVSLDYPACRQETVTSFGQPLIDAFEKHKPRLFGRAIFIDGTYQVAAPS
jgi:hypothetical protein